MDALILAFISPFVFFQVTQRTVLSVKLPYTLSELSKLTKEEAFELVKAHPSFKIIEKTAKTDLRTVSLEMVPNVRAELLFVKKESQSGRKKDAGSDDDDEWVICWNWEGEIVCISELCDLCMPC